VCLIGSDRIGSACGGDLRSMLLVFLVFEHLLVFFFLLQCSSSSMGLPTSQTVTERERERVWRGVVWRVCGGHMAAEGGQTDPI
jgi:hypothetical protein